MTNAAYELKLAQTTLGEIANAAMNLPCETLEEALSTVAVIRLCCEEVSDRLIEALQPGHGPTETLAANPDIQP